MTPRRTCLPFALAGAVLASGQQARASATDILIGLDSKVAYDQTGQKFVQPGDDTVLAMDVADLAHPRIRASLKLTNSLLGTPTNLRITPDGRLGLVANSVSSVRDGEAWKPAPDDKLYVIDLGSYAGGWVMAE